MMTRVVQAFLLVSALLLAERAAGNVWVIADAADLDFGSSDELVVRFEVDGAEGLTALEFSIVYPAEVLAIDEPATYSVNGVFSHAFVNLEADSSDLEPGLQRIAVAFSVAEPVTQSSGLLLTVTFPLRCSEFSGAWPEGRPVTIDLQDGGAWKATGGALPAPAALTVDGRTVTVDCTTVASKATGFSTLKARHGVRGGAR